MSIKKWLEKNCSDLTGKTIVISGSTGGIGKNIVSILSDLNANLVLLGRDTEKLDGLKNELLSKNAHIKIDIIDVDLSDFESVKLCTNTLAKYEKIDVIKELIEAVKFLSKSHTGALIVFQSDLSNTYYDVGTKLNADVSTELLLTIFHPNTPLHDGAVVINGSKIISAGVLLPLTEDPKLSWKYGTRHRAAIGMTETSNAACLVVSEETGDVSVALDGTLKKYEDIVSLKQDLEKILGYKNSEETDDKRTIFKINNLLAIRKTDTKS